MPRTRSIMVNGHPMHVVLPEETISHADLCEAAGYDEPVGLDVSYNIHDGSDYVTICPGESAPLVDGASYRVRAPE